MPTIYSTATNDITFAFYAEKKEGAKKVSANKIEQAIIIKGSLNQEVKSKRGKYGETVVTAEQLKLLKTHKQFIKGAASGFFLEKEPSSPKKDKSAQLTKEKVKSTTKAEVKTGKEEI
jgi:hypothetical protein